MNRTQLDFRDIQQPAPIYAEVEAEYTALEQQLDLARSAAECISVVEKWDQLRRKLTTWRSLVHLRFNQDTENEQYQNDRDQCDQMWPKLAELSLRLKRKLIASPYQRSLQQKFGAQAFARWQMEMSTHNPAIERDRVRQTKLEAEYTRLQASAQFEFMGGKYNLEQITRFFEHPDRRIRHDASRTRWNWFTKNRKALDRLFDHLVKLRAEMAQKLGFDDYTEMAYRLLLRVDYGREDVAGFRDAVRQEVVPLAIELKRRQADDLGLEKLMFWDEALHDPAGNPAPRDDQESIIQSAREMFDELGQELGSFFRLMLDADLFDLKSRPGKAEGGFCTDFPLHGVPFIFANFNGTKDDVEVFTHDMGHAFQYYMSQHQPLSDYHWPSSEACEIHAMSLEFLCWPHLEKLFADKAQRFREIQLRRSLLFLPYGAAIDHFQHLVYANPSATPAERNAMWQEMERMYLPWRRYGDLEHPSQGGMWQTQRHVYLVPFYYIDYTLAQTCALQFWMRSQSDFDQAMRSYVALCRRGGQLPFGQLVSSAGLRSPFDSGCLSQVVARVREAIGV